MKAIALTQFGDSRVLEEITVPVPELKPGHVLIQVMATSVNPLDIKLRKGQIPQLISHFPTILHGDVAGIIEAVGEGVHQFAKGDAVYGCVGGLLDLNGALAEYVLADAQLIAHKPESVDFASAAALPLVAETAWEAFISYANIQSHHRVLIHGGTGGVGHIAVQLAKWKGATVYATCSTPEKMEIAKKLGADEVFNYKTSHIEKQFDVILDTVGGDNIPKCFELAANYGKIVTLVARGVCDLSSAASKGLTLHMVTQPLPLITGEKRAHYGEILKKIANLVDSEIIRPLIDPEPFTLFEAARAQDYLESGKAIGKVVLRK